MTNLTRVAVVTGSNKGIGFAIVKNLAPQFQGMVYLTSRNPNLGRKALDEITGLGINNVRYHQLDITEGESINQFAQHIRVTYRGLDVLINNAACRPEDERSFGELAEEAIKVNFIGTLNVCRALFPLLRPHARVVNVASVFGQLYNIKNQDIADKISNDHATEQDITEVMSDYVRAAYDGTYGSLGFPTTIYGSYRVSKIGLVALTRVQQRGFDKDSMSGILVNSVCPGFVKTEMNGNLGMLTPDQGSQTPISLALIPENSARPRGEFFIGDSPSDWFTRDVVYLS